MNGSDLFFLPDNQVTAQIVKSMDWSKHPLGPPESWPATLKYTLNILFNTKHPTTFYWGEEKNFFYNDAVIPILGTLKHPWSMGKPGKEVWTEVWDDFSKQLDEVLINGSASWVVDRRIPIHRPGKSPEAYFTYSITPVLTENGVACGVLIISVETTERVIAEKKVLSTQKELLNAITHFKELSDSLPQLVWTSLPTGECNYLSKQWKEYTGKTEEELLGLEWINKVIHPEDQAMTQEVWLGAVKGKNPYDIEYRIRRYDGIYRWFKVRGSPLKNDQDEIIFWFGTCTDIEDTKQAQLNYEKNVDLSPAMLWITDPAGYCTYLSNQWYELTGQPIKEGVGFGWLELTHPDDQLLTGQSFANANEKHEPFEVEFRLRTKDGSYRWAIDAGNPRFGPNGEYLGMVGTVIDVHEKKLAEEALKESRADLYRILMQAPSGVAFLKGPDLVYSLANKRYQEIFGKGRSIIGQPMREALPELAETSFRIFEKVYQTGESFSAKEYKSNAGSKNGEEVYYSFAVQRINNSRGEPEGVIVIGDDVTDQVKNRLSREAATKQLQAIVENMNEGLILCDQNRKIHFWNPAAKKMYGIEYIDEVLENYNSYTSLFQFYSIEGDVIDMADWPISRALQGITFSGEEYIVEKLDTMARWIGSYSGSPIYNEEGDIVFAVVTMRDVTSRMDTERELKNAINSRDEFLSIISHELKTPLTSLKLQNQTAIRKIKKGIIQELTPEKLIILFDKNESQINRLIRLVDDMLDLTRIQSGKFSYHFVKCDLKEVIADVYDRFQEQFESTGTTLINQCHTSVEGFFDRERIEQVIINLLTNALKYGKGKAVVMKLKMINKVAHLEIVDHGIGINSENIETIFKKYERVVSADEVSGLGIGLFISREIVEAHGGKIWVESILGEGSKFIAELPLDGSILM